MTGPWYTVVTLGPSGSTPRGPWRSRTAALTAIERWKERMSSRGWTSEPAPETVRLNAYRTRATARHGAISDIPGTEGCLDTETLSVYRQSKGWW